VGRDAVRGVARVLNFGDNSISLNLSTASSVVVECAVCGYALPGGAGTPCPYCAAHPAVGAAAVFKAGADLIPCPQCGQPILPGDRSDCPHLARPAGLPG